MKKMMAVLLGVALSVPAIAFAQNTQQPNGKHEQQEANQAAQENMTGGSAQPQHTMSGMVSNGGRTLTSNNTGYVVNNPNALKDHDNQSVTVTFLFDTDNNSHHFGFSNTVTLNFAGRLRLVPPNFPFSCRGVLCGRSFSWNLHRRSEIGTCFSLRALCDGRTG